MSAVLKLKQLETIFDHGITDGEFEILFDFLEPQQDYKFALDQTDAYTDLYLLYQLRGNIGQAQFYLHKLDDKTQKRLTMQCCLD